MNTAAGLRQALMQIDRKSYPAYKSLKGEYQFEGYVLVIDHVQGDPFAAPSKVVLKVPKPGLPKELYDQKWKRIALQDYLIRQVEAKIRTYSFQAKGSGKSGLIAISHCGQQVLERSACVIEEANGALKVGIEVGFPANGRTINARELEKILFQFLPGCVKNTLFYQVMNRSAIQAVTELAVDQQSLRSQLAKLGLVGFVANGSILPRESGISEKPMKNAVAFQSPVSMEVAIELPYRGTIKGMGIKKGISLIVGGGYHGKSTLLRALELGVYNHCQGDGRELVITDETAMKIRAEDGRSIKNADISLFIQNLPNQKDTSSFDTEDASGSTSQAANTIEAIEGGSRLLLIDEDTSATNFMIRDELMQKVVHPKEEPITPFIERVRDLYEQLGVSTVIVAGSSGTYFHVADQILQMDHYKPKDVTAIAKAEALNYPMAPVTARGFQKPSFERRPKGNQKLRGNARIKMKSMGKDVIQIDKKTTDLHSVEQIVDGEQTQVLGYILLYMQQQIFDGKKTMQEGAAQILNLLEQQGLQAITGSNTYHGGLAMPRRQEIIACLNRCREISFR